MKYRFSRRSLNNLAGVHPKLVSLVKDCLTTGIMDFSVIDGLRTIDEQRKLVAKGVSKTMNSKHLPQKDGYSHAVDLAPYPLDWSDWLGFGRLAGIMQTLAPKHGFVLRWGCDWDSDGQTTDHKFLDAPHFEIKEII